jgi:putative membrane protein
MKRITVIVAGAAIAFAAPVIAVPAAGAPIALLLAQAQTSPAVPDFAPPGVGGQVGGGEVEGGEVEGAEVERAPLSVEDLVFLSGVTILFEIEVSRLALEQSTNAEVRDLARRILDDREVALRDLKAAAGADAPPIALDEDHERIVKAVAAEDKENFDESWLGLMIDTHEDAIGLYEEFDASGADEKLRGFAKSALPRLRESLTQVEEAHQKAVAGVPGGSR